MGIVILSKIICWHHFLFNKLAKYNYENSFRFEEQIKYWKKAYSLAGIEENHNDAQYSFKPIDEFWVVIGNILDEVTGTRKYQCLVN